MLIMTGLYGESRPEEVLNEAYEVSTLDLVEKGRKAENVGEIIVSTNSDSISGQLSEEVCAEVDSFEGSFHFGREFKRILKKYKPGPLLYFGGGSGILLDVEDLESFASLVSEREDVIIANNFYSSDFFGLNPSEGMLDVELPNRDNNFGWRSRGAGYRPFELKRTAKTLYDIDSPLDLSPLAITGAAKNRLEDLLNSFQFVSKEVEKVIPLLTDAESSITFAGRIGSSTWTYLESAAACETNIVSEGRGLYASGEMDRSSQKYVLSGLLERMGPEKTLEYLLGNSDALFLDTRVLYAGRGMWPDDPDRFWSDLKKPDKIKNEFVRKLTSASISFEEPVILCGHSMVSGALYLLADRAWEMVEPKSKRVQPKTLSLKKDGR